MFFYLFCFSLFHFNPNLQLHLALVVAENAARDGGIGGGGGGGDSDLLHAADEIRMAAGGLPNEFIPGLSRSGSQKSILEFVYPDTLRQRVTADECPVCQLMLPKGPNGCVCVDSYIVLFFPFVFRDRYCFRSSFSVFFSFATFYFFLIFFFLVFT